MKVAHLIRSTCSDQLGYNCSNKLSLTFARIRVTLDALSTFRLAARTGERTVPLVRAAERLIDGVDWQSMGCGAGMCDGPDKEKI